MGELFRRSTGAGCQGNCVQGTAGAGASSPLSSHFSHSQLSSSQASHNRPGAGTFAEACIGFPHFSHVSLRSWPIWSPHMR